VAHRLQGGQYFGELLRRQSVAGLLLTETRYPAGACIPRHSHERGYFCLVRRGRYREEFTGGERQCGPQTLAFHPPGEWHTEQFDGSEARSFNVELAPEWERRLDKPLNRPFATRQSGVVALGMRLYREFEQPDAASSLIVEGLTLELLGHFARSALPRPTQPPAWLQRVREQIMDSPVHLPNFTQLAADAQVHAGHLAATFRRFFGATVGEFARRCRIEWASRLLADSSRSLAEIAVAAGFADQSHFTRCFRREFGVTPAAYRRVTQRSKT
jgi:AraC family transcriptional regulator